MAKSILDALASVTEDDLTSIDAEIAVLQKKLDALRQARSVVDVTLHGPKQRAARDTGKVALRKAKQAAAAPVVRHDEPEEGRGDSCGQRIYDLLSEQGGMAVAAVAAQLKISPSIVYERARSDGRFGLVAGELRIKK